MNIKNTKLYYTLRNQLRKFYRKLKVKGTGGTNSARYCYSVFMRHIVNLYANGMKTIPLRVAEFGPGDSLGIGLCAILAGAKEYYALDVVEHANLNNNLRILDELINLFKGKTSVPDNNEFPKISPILDDFSFPSYIFDNKHIEKNLSEERIISIKQALIGGKDDIKIKYLVPWENYSENYPIVDFIFSQAVLEHIDNLKQFYIILKKMLIKNGFSSHVIDFKSHGETYEWNGHWAISDKKWKKIKGKRPYLINREPLSTHIALFKENGFNIILKSIRKGNSKQSVKRNQLTERFSFLSNEDFETCGCFIIAQKYS